MFLFFFVFLMGDFYINAGIFIIFIAFMTFTLVDEFKLFENRRF